MTEKETGVVTKKERTAYKAAIIMARRELERLEKSALEEYISLNGLKESLVVISYFLNEIEEYSKKHEVD